MRNGVAGRREEIFVMVITLLIIGKGSEWSEKQRGYDQLVEEN
jgi:hypothetical protein